MLLKMLVELGSYNLLKKLNQFWDIIGIFLNIINILKIIKSVWHKHARRHFVFMWQS